MQYPDYIVKRYASPDTLYGTVFVLMNPHTGKLLMTEGDKPVTFATGVDLKDFLKRCGLSAILPDFY